MMTMTDRKESGNTEKSEVRRSDDVFSGNGIAVVGEFSIIVAMCEKTRGIGYQGTIPWKSKEDMTFFRETTTAVPSNDYINAVIMGRKTFESLGSRPLKGRLNLVCSRTLNIDNVIQTLDEGLMKISKEKNIHKIFVIGGEGLYSEALNHPNCSELIINCMKIPLHDYDTFFPEIDTKIYYLTESRETEDILYLKYARRTHTSS